MAGKKNGKFAISILVFHFALSLVLGGMLGVALAETLNTINTENFTEFETALPTRLLDVNGETITSLASEEKREIIAIRELPKCMIDALLSREDHNFYNHHGFSLKAVLRAVVGKIFGISFGGGSTLTQQIAGTLYCDRTEMSITRKIKELWWAIQMERRYSKNEILELYLNKIYFGGGTYGVNAASKYYFDHDAKQINPAEAAILAIQLSNPAFYNPFDYPNRAMGRQKDVLNTMVRFGFLTRKEADESFDDYWGNFDYTRTSTTTTAHTDDKAPWFSEYVRRELSTMIYGADDIYTSGFTVHTTLDLKRQKAAEKVMEKYISYANKTYQNQLERRKNEAFRIYPPLSELISLVFNLPGIKVSQQRNESLAFSTYTNEINPVVDIFSLMLGLENLKMGIVHKSNTISKQKVGKTTIEGTMIAIENETGYITSLVGGSKFESENQFIRAIQAKVQPGSTFKPLYYSAAIDSKKYTATTIISDTPVVFYTPDGKPYIPQNFRGEWDGDVQLWYALVHSMNVPSLKILDGIGFDSAIERAAILLDIPQSEFSSRAFVPGYPLGLGTCSVRPIELARAYAVFENEGKDVTPIAIRNIEDKNGNVVLNPELETRKKQSAKGQANQIISAQTSFVMTELLRQTVQTGTLANQGWKFEYRDNDGKKRIMPAAGKTGTTQNWADAWAAGYTPYITSIFWFGFDKPGQSLGTQITGSTLAGYAWGDYMREVHRDLPVKQFPKPPSGVIRATVCSVSGGILTAECGNHKTTQWYLEGTAPTEICSVHSNSSGRTLAISRLEKELYKTEFINQQKIFDDEPLKFNLNFEQPTIENPRNDFSAIDFFGEDFSAPNFNRFME